MYECQKILMRNGLSPDYAFELYPGGSPRCEFLIVDLDALHMCGYVEGDVISGPLCITDEGKRKLDQVKQELKEIYGESLEEIAHLRLN